MGRWELGCSINIMKKKKSNNSGLSILEALVSTAIVGIGFIAILQMTNFSAQSITNSGERTKANYLTGMIAEDVIGSKNTLFGINSDSEDIQYGQDGSVSLASGADASDVVKFSEHLNTNGWNAQLNCGGSTNTSNTADAANNTGQENIYDTQNIDAPRNKKQKWDLIFNENRFLKCRTNNETKKVEVFSVCRWPGCTNQSDLVFDEPIFIGRVEMKLNDGKKRKFLYFQSDYKIKTENSQAPGGQDGEGGMIGQPSG